MRGGGGNFGVVTALEFRMYDIETAYAGFLMWDLAHAEPVLREWAAWAPDAPDEVTTSFRVMRMPPMPELPDFLRGRELVIIDGAVLGSDERGAELLAGLRALRPGDGHLRAGPREVAGPAAHGPRGRRAVRLRQRDARVASPTPRSTPSSPRSARTPDRRC